MMDFKMNKKIIIILISVFSISSIIKIITSYGDPLITLVIMPILFIFIIKIKGNDYFYSLFKDNIKTSKRLKFLNSSNLVNVWK